MSWRRAGPTITSACPTRCYDVTRPDAVGRQHHRRHPRRGLVLRPRRREPPAWRRMHYGGRPALICQLEVIYDDGGARAASSATGRGGRARGRSSTAISWSANATTRAHEMPGWDEPGHRRPALAAGRGVRARAAGAASRRRALPAGAGDGSSWPCTSLSRLRDDGTARSTISGRISPAMCGSKSAATSRPGRRSSLRHGERLADDGSLYVANLRQRGGDRHLRRARRAAAKRFKPHFTFHGFQYVELTLPAGVSPDRVTLTAIAVYNDLPVAGAFACGNALVNQLASNIVWSQRGNFLSVPTDCPQRDERLGWTGATRRSSARTAGFNMDVVGLLRQVDGRHRRRPAAATAPSPTSRRRSRSTPIGRRPAGRAGLGRRRRHHALAASTCGYGDRGLLDGHYAAIERVDGAHRAANPDLIRRQRGLQQLRRLAERRAGIATGRWSATAYWVYIADIMARDRRRARQEQTTPRRYRAACGAASGQAFVAKPSSATTGSIAGDTQTAYLLALDFDFLPPELREQRRGHLRRRSPMRDGHLQTGFLGVEASLPGAGRHRRVDARLPAAAQRRPIRPGGSPSGTAPPRSGSAGTAGRRSAASRART